RQVQDTIALLTGLSVLRMTKAAVWALGFTPGPLFVSTYLFLRRRYALGVAVGGAALAFFISTSDVGVVHGLVGVLGAVAALGFGRLDREGG
ncbi:MAG: transglutaminase, partial [Actinobacteria bacterium]|nr:transglutaminase [Actinomycetota bacterium]NIX25835.1 transglutaminase [Actinomycetota bacterium]